MSKPKFTLGPWRVIESGIIAEGKFVIARIYLDPLKEENAAIEESIANDHLIAAAPDLYAELQNIANADPTKWDEDTRDQFQQWAQSRARAALKKARGE